MSQTEPHDESTPASSRRGFFAAAAAGLAGVAIAPGIRLIEVAQAAPARADGVPVTQGVTAGANPRVRWGMLVDTNRCASGCTDCVDACNTEHGLPARPTTPSTTTVQWIRKVEIQEKRSGRTASAPVMCQHCANPPCCDVCPTQASFKRADGIVLVDRHTCIGCRYCVMACPYKARSFVREPVTNQKPDMPRGKGTVESCTFCVHRIDAGQTTTACAEACSKAGHRAIVFGNLNDPDSEISRRIREVPTVQLRADLRLDLGVRYEGLGT
jgi:molybdopterin-containing oxidoreductase family iron-sulfur binding subunit